ncbi:MAG: hypothetical protein JXR84_27380 [Anaerolineae bacterium]|nr:hypothetical protein [Anaerolineae bacterium]
MSLPCPLAFLDKAHLIYLALLPAWATGVTLATYGHRSPFLIFLGGIVVVAVYLAVIVHYSRPATSLGVALLALIDGPLWAAGAQLSGRGAASFAVDAFLVDGVAIWIAIAWLAVTTSRPTREQLVATLAFAVIAVGTVCSLFWPYLRQNLWGQWLSIGLLLMGIGEAIVAYHYLLEKDEVVRDERFTMPYLIVFIAVWVASMIIGMVVYEL